MSPSVVLGEETQLSLPGKLHHVGIACRDLLATRDWVRATFPVSFDSGVIHDPVQDADLCLLHVSNQMAIELVSGPVVQGMLRRRTSYYHLCYEVDDISTSIAALEADGCRLISGPVPAILFGGRPVAFLLSPIGLLELLGAE
jgi:methylmalonyl-CoA/ethylmalonyl-CoA epimerase